MYIRYRLAFPAIMKHEYRIVTLLQVLIDKLLRPSDAANRIFPSDRKECDLARLGMQPRIFFQQVTKALTFFLEPMRRGDEDSVLCERLWHESARPVEDHLEATPSLAALAHYSIGL
jgi:hypothetical protein